jgi:hypothetical protein
MKIVGESSDWESCRRILSEDSKLPSGDMEAFLAPYDYWYTH